MKAVARQIDANLYALDGPEPVCQWCGGTTGEVLAWETGDQMHTDCHAAANPACDGAGLLWLVPMAVFFAFVAWYFGLLF